MHLAPFADSMPLMGDPDRLRVCAEADGFLCFSGLLDRELVCSAARCVLEYASRVGWQAPPAPIAEDSTRSTVLYPTSATTVCECPWPSAMYLMV